ncbi:MAG: glucose-1-phosphate cytidylyltransferase [Candidatus Paracaedibacteraceae bacterium]|nr:glucose-1-phosphate cytidylyltransferase [Candidatus Paracaedibacteraceae bacterium]
MKIIILAGGFGTRLSEETGTKPKPMVEIGNRPILWHIMKIYAHFGFHEFIVAMGYKADYIKKYFIEYPTYSGNLTVQIDSGQSKIVRREQDDWTIHLEDTGHDTMTGGRIKKLSDWVSSETFMVTYGDGVSDVPIDELLKFHKSHGKLVTITAVRPPSRFGGLVLDGAVVTEFTEKAQAGEGWINGGFMVLEPEVLTRIKDSSSSLEFDVFEDLAKEGQIAAFCHDGFWQCMDTLRDLKHLEGLWNSGKAPWKLWN